MLKIGIFSNKSIQLVSESQRPEISFLSTEFHESENEKTTHITKAKNQIELIRESDLIICEPEDNKHFEICKTALRYSKHVFLPDPLSLKPEEAKTLIELSDEGGTHIQVCHNARFLNQTLNLIPQLENPPKIIIAERRNEFQSANLEKSALYKQMFEEIDLVHFLMKTNVRKIHVNGVHILTDYPNMIHVRLDFFDGGLANILIDQVHGSPAQQIKIYTKLSLFELDYQSGFTKTYVEGKEKQIAEFTPEPLYSLEQKQFEIFLNDYLEKRIPTLTIQDTYTVLKLMQQINDRLHKQ